jgi:hypothetical protein
MSTENWGDIKVNSAGSRESGSVGWFWALAVAAILVMIVGGWGTLQLWRERYVESEEVEAILNLGVAVHIHCAIDTHIADGTFTPEKMALAMGPRYVGLVSLLERTLPKDFLVPVAHQCSFDGHNYVHIIIKNPKGGSGFSAFERGPCCGRLGNALTSRFP